jgi:thioredoxin reductase
MLDAQPAAGVGFGRGVVGNRHRSKVAVGLREEERHSRASRVRSSPSASFDAVVIGAGPYGLAAATHLQHAGVDVRAFGEPMASWDRNMPAGMLLRSLWNASHIADPEHKLGLDVYESELRLTHEKRIPLARFVDYGRWYQQRALPSLDLRRVVLLQQSAAGFRLLLDDEEELDADRVVVAAGIMPFAWRPPVLAAFPQELVSHTSEHSELSRFRDRRVLVLGGGQSAFESAALLSEAGANVEVVVRRPIFWHTDIGHVGADESKRRLLLYAYHRTAVGGPRSSWIAARPSLCRLMPRERRAHFSYRLTRPACAYWLRSRLTNVCVTEGAAIVAASEGGGRVRLRLSDDSTRDVDHVLLGTGYRIDVGRYDFLSPELLGRILTWNGSPVLSRGFESSVSGLYFVGETAAASFGPVLRFVCGSWAAARGVTRAIVGRGAPRAGFTW